MRVQFPTGQQRTFLDNLLHATSTSTTALAASIGVHPRTFRDWRREKWQMDDASLDRLCVLANLPRLEGITLLPEYWSVAKASRIGGLRHVELYGSPGTPEGRSRGGQNAQKRFRANPEYFRSLGIALRKPVARPSPSANFAEFIGIMLGDGGMTNCQATITFNSLDTDYADYVSRLGQRLFRISSSQRPKRNNNAFYVRFSGVELIEALEAAGLKRGNKVRHQVDVPGWIWQQRAYRIACLRGLMDTDGCVFRHKYRVNGKVYAYTKLAFTNYSRPLLLSAKKSFEDAGLFPTLHRDGHRLYLHDTRQVKRYFEVIGTRNPRYQARYDVSY